MDALFGVAELTEAEKLVMGLEDGKNMEGTVEHKEHAGYAQAAAATHRSNTVEVMASISELNSNAGRRV